MNYATIATTHIDSFAPILRMPGIREENPEPRGSRAEAPAASRREIVAWAMYDFANSSYTTVVLTAIFNAYFVGTVAGREMGYAPGTGTLLWTIAMGVSNLLVLLSAPVLGAVADLKACKKRFLAWSTVGCVLFTAMQPPTLSIPFRVCASCVPGEVVDGACKGVKKAILDL